MTTTTNMIVFQSSFYTPMEQAAINKLQHHLSLLIDKFVERNDIIESMAVALLCKQHEVFIGPPGTAKSALINAFRMGVQGFRMFEWQLTKYSIPEEIFGPYMLSALKNDEFKRKKDGKLPDAEIVYLDEVFNANSSILNATNSSMNERIFENKPIPLQTLYGASNFIPEESALVAFFDRFLFRFIVQEIHESANFEKMITNRGPFVPDPSAILTKAEVDALQKKVSQVKITVIPQVVKLRELLKAEQIEPSSRRFQWALTALQALAVISGREEVIEDDLYLLQHILWTDKKEIPIVEAMIANCISPAMAKIKDLVKQAFDIDKQLKKVDPDKEGNKLLEGAKKLKLITDEIAQTVKHAQFNERNNRIVASILKQIAETRQSIRNRLNLDD